MEIPEKPTKTLSNSVYGIQFNPAIPIVRSISGVLLENEGFVRHGSEYVKNGLKISYDGVYWWKNGERVQFIEDLKQ